MLDTPFVLFFTSFFVRITSGRWWHMNMTVCLSEIEKGGRKHLATLARLSCHIFPKVPLPFFFFSLHLRAPSYQIQISSWPFRSSGSSSLPLPDIVHHDKWATSSPYRKPISLISHSDVRYRGILAGIDPAASTIQLSNGTNRIYS
jgi:hypothetical protein